MILSVLKKGMAPIVLILVLAVGVGGASAAVPWWHVSTIYSPAQKQGKEGTVEVEVSNLARILHEAAAAPMVGAAELSARAGILGLLRPWNRAWEGSP